MTKFTVVKLENFLKVCFKDIAIIKQIYATERKINMKNRFIECTTKNAKYSNDDVSEARGPTFNV